MELSYFGISSGINSKFAAAPSGSAELRKPELTSILLEILDNVALYGGVLAALAFSLLLNFMNGDYHVVYHVHSSGITKSFFRMVSAERTFSAGNLEPILPPVAELIMALPMLLVLLV